MSLQDIPETFGKLTDAMVTRLIQLMKRFKTKRLDFVTDKYPSTSIKTVERTHCGDGGKQAFCVCNKMNETPTQWKKFLIDGKTKKPLLSFCSSIGRMQIRISVPPKPISTLFMDLNVID